METLPGNRVRIRRMTRFRLETTSRRLQSQQHFQAFDSRIVSADAWNDAYCSSGLFNFPKCLELTHIMHVWEQAETGS